MNELIVRQMALLEQSHWWFVARRKILVDLLGAAVGQRDRIVVVDLGCGAGGNLASLADRYRCIGVDPSAEAIRLAMQRHPGIEFLCGELPHRLPRATSQADVILAMDVLEHIEHDAEALKAVVDNAADGAAIVVTVPADMALWSPHDESHGHYRRYERDSFAQLWAGLPVATALLSYFNTRLYPLIRLARTWSRWRRKSWGEADTDLFLPPGTLNSLLCSVFAGEGRVLVDTLRSRRPRGYSYGASLVAILRKQTVVVRGNGASATPALRLESRPCATAF